MKEHDKALETYDSGLAHDPTNEELREGKQRTMQAIAQVRHYCGIGLTHVLRRLLEGPVL